MTTESGTARGARPAPTDAEVQAFTQKAFGDLGGMLVATMVVIGDQRGLYRALDTAGAATPAELAQRTGTAERYGREWASPQPAPQDLPYDAPTGRYPPPPHPPLVPAREA